MAEQDLLLPESLAPLVKHTIFAGHIHYWPEVESTNTLALQAAALGSRETEAGEGTVFLADAQTAGRGRGGHSWHSEPGSGIYASFLLRPEIAPAHILWLSLISAIAVQDAVQEAAGLTADIRWPNDLLLDEKKFCGILTEASSDSSRVQYAVVGIGINVNHAAFPESLAPIATSLRIVRGAVVPRVPLVASLIRCFDRNYRILLKAGTIPEDLSGRQFKPIMEKLTGRSSYIYGKQVEVVEEDGYTGVTDGLDSRGFLRIRTDHGLRTVISGSVRPLTTSKES
jgi:BirA family transcriptional regulator, biotin operon repressor / biotin---[acetyl-CoA-carboxylase] ligase